MKAAVKANGGEPRVKKISRRNSTEKTYAQIARGKSNSGDDEEEWKGQIWVTDDKKKWMERSLIGRVHNREDFEKVKESFIQNGIGFIRIIYLGYKVVLISGEEGVDVCGREQTMDVIKF